MRFRKIDVPLYIPDIMQNKIQSFTDLEAWKIGHKFVLKIYTVTNKFPNREAYSLADQMRRSAISITSNIAEGFSRKSKKDKSRFYSITLGSTTELQNQLVLARDLHYVSKEDFHALADQSVCVSKFIRGLLKSASSY